MDAPKIKKETPAEKTQLRGWLHFTVRELAGSIKKLGDHDFFCSRFRVAHSPRSSRMLLMMIESSHDALTAYRKNSRTQT
jgi:hypothetical protein